MTSYISFLFVYIISVALDAFMNRKCLILRQLFNEKDEHICLGE